MLVRDEYSASKNRWQHMASWSPSQNGQTRWTEVTNAAADDVTRSRPFLAGRFATLSLAERFGAKLVGWGQRLRLQLGELQELLQVVFRLGPRPDI
ncbi:hypothetical protein T09_15441 [Trichinella sp. T9]|nr:hypothetical protein T09_15441 [Trichinella sp. T9]